MWIEEHEQSYDRLSTLRQQNEFQEAVESTIIADKDTMHIKEKIWQIPCTNQGTMVSREYSTNSSKVTPQLMSYSRNFLVLPKYLLTLGATYIEYIFSLYINIKYLLSCWSYDNDRLSGKTHEQPESQREIDGGSCMEIYWVMSLNNLISTSSTAFEKDEVQLYFIKLYIQQYLKWFSAAYHVVIW